MVNIRRPIFSRKTRRAIKLKAGRNDSANIRFRELFLNDKNIISRKYLGGIISKLRSASWATSFIHSSRIAEEINPIRSWLPAFNVSKHVLSNFHKKTRNSFSGLIFWKQNRSKYSTVWIYLLSCQKSSVYTKSIWVALFTARPRGGPLFSETNWIRPTFPFNRYWRN